MNYSIKVNELLKDTDVELEEVKQSKKLNVTKHSLERWCERIISLPLQEINAYITTNRSRLIENINETFSYAEFIYKGQLGTDNITRHYYLQNDIVFVSNTDDNAIITVYKVDLGFTDDINTMLRKEMMKEVIRLTEIKYDFDVKSLAEVDEIKFELSEIDDLTITLENQLNDLKRQKKLKQEQLKEVNFKGTHINHELAKYVMKLVNSKEYKDDLNKI